MLTWTDDLLSQPGNHDTTTHPMDPVHSLFLSRWLWDPTKILDMLHTETTRTPQPYANQPHLQGCLRFTCKFLKPPLPWFNKMIIHFDMCAFQVIGFFMIAIHACHMCQRDVIRVFKYKIVNQPNTLGLKKVFLFMVNAMSTVILCQLFNSTFPLN